MCASDDYHLQYDDHPRTFDGSSSFFKIRDQVKTFGLWKQRRALLCAVMQTLYGIL